MWSELSSRLSSAAFSSLLDDAAIATASRLLEALAASHEPLARYLYEAAATQSGQDLWRALLASEFLREALIAEAAFALQWLHDGCPAPDTNASPDDAVALLGPETGLRRFRRQTMLVIGWLDIAGRLPLADVLAALSALADRCLQVAMSVARHRMQQRHGELRDSSGAAVPLYAICMGKLGGRELNFSSDIDLIFVYARDGESDGRKPLLASEYALREARLVIELIDAPGHDGRVFRVDTRLRPFGEAGPLAISLSSLEAYLQQHGRDWERYAFVKARFVGAASASEQDLGDAVRRFRSEVLRPFVYRRYLDFGVLSSLRDMKQMIATEVARRDMQDHLKLGPGGIREIEFIAQSWQLIRGGQVAGLRTAQLVSALHAAGETGCLSGDAVRDLLAAYALLRQVENRLQALNDRQTHRLPATADGRAALALAMHAANWDSLMATLDQHRQRVIDHFAGLLLPDDGTATMPSPPAWLDVSPEALTAALADTGVVEPDAVAAVLLSFRERISHVPLERIARERLARFLDGVIRLLEGHQTPSQVIERALQVASAVLRRSAYLSLLNEQPDALRRLLTLCAASAYLSTQMAQYPMLLDELLDTRLFDGPVGAQALREELAVLVSERRPTDAEAHMQVLVQFARVVWFRIAVADCSDEMPIMRVSDHLSEVAEIVLERTLAIAWEDVTAKFGAPAGCRAEACHFAIVAYGKLGGLELGYGSDLDIVFLHDLPDGETCGKKPLDHSVFVARLATRIVHFLGVQTGNGRLFEVDIRLRPSGRSGLLVTTLAAFRRYQQEDAWTWEHQALTRARAVAGDAALRAAFEAVRREVLCDSVRRDGLAGEVLSMRARMRRELSAAGSGEFDMKQDAGGIADIEFLVQYLVLAHACEAPALLDWSDNIRQLDSLAAAGLLDAATAAALQDSYRAYRQRVHRLSLDRKRHIVSGDEFTAERAVVAGAWRQVFGEPPSA